MSHYAMLCKEMKSKAKDDKSIPEESKMTRNDS